MERLATKMDFVRLTNLHNSSGSLLYAPEPVYIGLQCQKDVRCFALANPHLLDNLACAKNWGW